MCCYQHFYAHKEDEIPPLCVDSIIPMLMNTMICEHHVSFQHLYVDDVDDDLAFIYWLCCFSTNMLITLLVFQYLHIDVANLQYSYIDNKEYVLVVTY